MPETVIQKNLARDQYIQRNKSVNIRQNIEKREKIEKSGLKDIEIRKTSKQLGKDDFLQLLITQLTHQDPTSPVKDQAFIAQMAQFSSLEQMKNVSSTLKTMSERQSQSLVGKFLIGKDHLNGEQVSGVAQAMFYDKSGDAFFKVGGKIVRVNDITLIGNPENFKKEYGGTAPIQGNQHRQNQAIQNNNNAIVGSQKSSISTSRQTELNKPKSNVEIPQVEQKIPVKTGIQSAKEYENNMKIRENSSLDVSR